MIGGYYHYYLCWGDGGVREKQRGSGGVLQDDKRGRLHISTQNLKALGSWATSLIYSTFFPFIVDVGLDHSLLKPNNLPCSVSSHIL
jgi:hypothetical protein